MKLMNIPKPPKPPKARTIGNDSYKTPIKEIALVTKSALKTVILLFILLGMNAILFKNDNNVIGIFIIALLYGVCDMIEIQYKK